MNKAINDSYDRIENARHILIDLALKYQSLSRQEILMLCTDTEKDVFLTAAQQLVDDDILDYTSDDRFVSKVYQEKQNVIDRQNEE